MLETDIPPELLNSRSVFLEQFGNAAFVSRLKQLWISYHPFIPQSLIAACTNLDELWYTAYNFDFDRPDVRNLLASGCLDHLKELHLTSFKFISQDMKALAEADLPSLIGLGFTTCHFPEDGFCSWRTAKWTPQIKELNINGGVGWESQAVTLFAKCDFKNLEVLSVNSDDKQLDARPLVRNSHKFQSLLEIWIQGFIVGTAPEFLYGLQKFKNLRLLQPEIICKEDLLSFVGDFPKLDFLEIVSHRTDHCIVWDDCLAWIKLQTGKMPLLGELSIGGRAGPGGFDLHSTSSS